MPPTELIPVTQLEYERGFADGRKAVLKWRKVDHHDTDTLPPFGSSVLGKFKYPALSENGEWTIGLVELRGNEFMWERIFAGCFGVVVTEWCDPK